MYLTSTALGRPPGDMPMTNHLNHGTVVRHTAQTLDNSSLVAVQILCSIDCLIVSNNALCIITGLMPITIKIEEATKYYEITKDEGSLYHREMAVKNWIQPAKHMIIIDGHEDSAHYIQAYTDGSKNEVGVGSGIAVFSGSSLKTTFKYRLNERCTNNQAEQMAILKPPCYF
jgi:hypothetical protein